MEFNINDPWDKASAALLLGIAVLLIASLLITF